MKTDSDETAMNLTAGHRPEAYSPECMEGEFSEAHMQDPA
jgi:hypothetical protein